MDVKVKICGLTKIEDINAVNLHLPEYIGFVFSNSKRQITQRKAVYLSQALDKRISICGIFRDEKPEDVIRISESIGFSVIQLHGNEDLSYIRELKKNVDVRIWKGCYVSDPDIFKYLEITDKVVTDSISPGTGAGYDRKLLTKYSGSADKLVVAGGLDPYNVKDLLDIITPYCVDVSTGVEYNDNKNEALIGKFINEVRMKKNE